MDADGGEFAAGGVGLAEAVEAAAEFGGIVRAHFGAPGAIVGGQGAGGGEQVGEDFIVGPAGGVDFEEGGRGQPGGIGCPVGFHLEEMGQFAAAVKGAVEEAFEGVAGDVGGEEVHGAEQRRGQGGLVFPDIEGAGGNEMAVERALEGVGIDDLAAGGIEEPGAGGEFAEQAAVNEVPRGERTAGFQRNVEGEDVRARQDGFEGQVVGRSGFERQRRVVAKDAQAEQAGLLRDAGADLADADDADRAARQEGGAPAGQEGEGGDGVLGDGVGVAAGRGAPGDAGLVQPGDVEVVGAGGGGGDKAHGRALEQGGVHLGLGADNERAGVAEVGAANFAVGHDEHFAEAGESLAGVQDAGGADDLHGGGRGGRITGPADFRERLRWRPPCPAGIRRGRGGFAFPGAR